jgi:ribonuclease HI
MKLAKEMEVTDLRAKSDSQLVNNQVSGEYQTKDPQLMKYLERVNKLKGQFNTFELIFVPREQNSRADLLSKLASTKKPGNNRTMIHEVISKPSTEDTEIMMIVEEEDWGGPITKYLQNETLPPERD